MKKQKTILVAEDDSGLRQALVDTLRLSNFTVIEATNGEEMLNCVSKECPDLILLDILMPVMDGMTALKKLRETDCGFAIPVIILTNQNATNEELIEDMVNSKPLYYLIKSDWGVHDVAKKINEILKPSSGL